MSSPAKDSAPVTSQGSARPATGTGLSQSGPLVTLPSSHAFGAGIFPVSQQSIIPPEDSSIQRTVATMDHPLAAMPPAAAAGGPPANYKPPSATTPYAPPPNSSNTSDPQQRGAPYDQAPPPAALLSSISTGAPPKIATALPKIRAASASPTHTLDDLAEMFLSSSSAKGGPPFNNNNNNKSVASASSVTDLKSLVDRRDWGAVLDLCNRLLSPVGSTANSSGGSSSSETTGGGSHYAPIYASLLQNEWAPSQPQSSSLSSSSSSTQNTSSKLSLTIILESLWHELATILICYIKALIALRKFTDLEHTLERWSFCHSIDDSATIGPPALGWEIHVVTAAALQYTSANETTTTANTNGIASPHKESMVAAVDALNKLEIDLPQDSNGYAARLQLKQELANIYSKQQEWRLALGCLQDMIGLLEFGTAEKTPETGILKAAYTSELLSRQGRILLQAGVIEGASEIFLQASNQADMATSALGTTDTSRIAQHPAVLRLPVQLAVNQGILCFSHKNHPQALEFFRNAQRMLREKISQSTAEGKKAMEHSFMEVLSLPPDHFLYTETVNNMALCALYTSKLSDAVYLMESLAREDPPRHMTERVVRNLCQLYELSGDTSTSARHKRVLQRVASRCRIGDLSDDAFGL